MDCRMQRQDDVATNEATYRIVHEQIEPFAVSRNWSETQLFHSEVVLQ